MSTTFAVKVKNELIPVAFKSSNGITWKNELAELLPNNTKVIAIDNTNQGINTIGDIKDKIFLKEHIIICKIKEKVD